MEVMHNSPGFCWDHPATRVISKPLHGYTFYIDAQDEDEEHTVENLEGKITSLGGTIRKLLSKGILYFISGNSGKKAKCTRRSGRFLKQNETRAKVAKAREITYPCTALDRARTLGLRIFTLAKVMQWLKEVERRRIYLSPTKVNPKCKGGNRKDEYQPVNNKENEYREQSHASPPSLPSLSDFKSDITSKNHDEELIPPFLKVEDHHHIYEPQYLEFDVSFPILDLNGKMPRSPFRKPSLNTTMDVTLNTTHHELATLGGDGDIDDDGVEKTLSSTSNYSRSGWCDFCESFFRIRDRHIKSKKHQTNRPLETFQKLDELIAACGTLDDFIARADEAKMKREGVTEQVGSSEGNDVTEKKTQNIRLYFNNSFDSTKQPPELHSCSREKLIMGGGCGDQKKFTSIGNNINVIR